MSAPALVDDERMDQGLAALIAGIAGAAGGLGGAIAGGLAAARGASIGAEKTATALLRQTQDQGEIEHQHWAREQRRLACTEVMQLYSGVVVAAATMLGSLRNDVVPSEENRGALLVPSTAFPLACLQVRLWGPPELGRTSTVLGEHVRQASVALLAWSDAVELSAPNISARRAAYEAVDLRDAFSAFTRVAGEALRTPTD